MACLRRWQETRLCQGARVGRGDRQTASAKLGLGLAGLGFGCLRFLRLGLRFGFGCLRFLRLGDLLFSLWLARFGFGLGVVFHDRVDGQPLARAFLVPAEAITLRPWAFI